MIVLGIETATTVCGVAAVSNAGIVAQEQRNQKHAHAESIMGMVERVVRLSGGMRMIGGVAVSIGPGSFTGLRIGVSVAKGLAFSRGLPVVGVATLEALLSRVREADQSSLAGESARILALLVARRGEFYVRASWENETRILTAGEIVTMFAGSDIILTGEHEALAHDVRLPDSWNIAAPDFAQCSAATVGRIGERLLAAGRSDDLALLEPAYTMQVIFKHSHPERT